MRASRQCDARDARSPADARPLRRFRPHVEAKAFHGLWLTDSFGRGRPTLDPIVGMSVIAAVTSRIEIGTCVLQVPVRHPVELAHRIESLYALTGSRLQLGVGSGSTQADFDILGLDYAQRFKLLMRARHMGKAWPGALAGGARPRGPAPRVARSSSAPAQQALDRLRGRALRRRTPRPLQPTRGAWKGAVYHDAGGKRAVPSNVIVELQGNVATCRSPAAHNADHRAGRRSTG